MPPPYIFSLLFIFIFLIFFPDIYIPILSLGSNHHEQKSKLRSATSLLCIFITKSLTPDITVGSWNDLLQKKIRIICSLSVQGLYYTITANNFYIKFFFSEGNTDNKTVNPPHDLLHLHDIFICYTYTKINKNKMLLRYICTRLHTYIYIYST